MGHFGKNKEKGLAAPPWKEVVQSQPNGAGVCSQSVS